MTFSRAVHPAPRLRRRSLRRLGALAVAATLSLVALTARPARAATGGEASASYQGAFSSTNPTDYIPAPDAHQAGDTLTYAFTVSNTTALPQTLTATAYYEWVDTVGADQEDVSSGQPAVTEQQILTGPVTGEGATPFPTQPINNDSYIPFGSTSYTVQAALPANTCGYLLVWVGDTATWQADGPKNHPADFLNAGATRITGCSTPPSPTASTSSSTTGSSTPTPQPLGPPASSPQATPTPPPGRTPQPLPGGGSYAPVPVTVARPPTPSASPSASPSARPSASASPTPATLTRPATHGGTGIVRPSATPSPTAAPSSTVAQQSAIHLGGRLEDLVATLFVFGFLVGLAVLVMASLKRLWGWRPRRPRSPGPEVTAKP